MKHTVEYTSVIRLDRFLKHLYPLLTQGVIQKALRAGSIKLNSIKAKDAGMRLNHLDVVEVAASFAQYVNKPDEGKIFNASIKALSTKLLGQYLVFANNDFIIINKPAKIASQSGSKLNISVDEALQYMNMQSRQNSSLCFKLVHRLDKETSGLMIIAKHYDAAVKLTKAFAEKKIYKTYIAVAHFKAKANAGEIRLQDELTGYKVLKYIANRNISVVEFTPITGKEHQIRRHALEIGLKIIGDKKYGLLDKAPYMLLHAKKVVIDASVFGKEFSFEGLLPEYFSTYC